MLTPWKKSYYKPRQSIESRDIILLTKVCIVKAMVFPVIMYGRESWTIKKAECQSTDAFKLWCWRRLLRVPWTARRSSQSILKKINPEYSLEGLMLKLKLQYFGYLMQRKDPDAGKGWRQEKKGATEDEMVGWHHQLDGHEFEQAPGGSEGQGSLVCLQSMGSQQVRQDSVTELQQWERRGQDWNNSILIVNLGVLIFLSTLHESAQQAMTGSTICIFSVCLVLSNSEILWTVAHQAPLSMGFPRHEYWSGLPFPPSGNLPDPGIEPASPVSPASASEFFTTELSGKPICILQSCKSTHRGIKSPFNTDGTQESGFFPAIQWLNFQCSGTKGN